MSRIIINVNYAENSRLTKPGLYKGSLYYIWFVKHSRKTLSIANVLLVSSKDLSASSVMILTKVFYEIFRWLENCLNFKPCMLTHDFMS